MSISLLRIGDFRNIKKTEIKPHPCGLNLIYGQNGSGKTSLLEAIYYLSCGRSFKNVSPPLLIRKTAPSLSLFAHVLSENNQSIPVGIERHTNGRVRLRVSEQEVNRFAELATLLPMRLIHSQSHQLFEAGPAFRRQFIDWGLFYQNPAFFSCWRHFERALKQRNAVLKDQRPLSELHSWTYEFEKYGVLLNELRVSYVNTFRHYFDEIIQNLLDVPAIKITYQCGWADDRSLSDALKACNTQTEYLYGYTQIGPHRADLELTIEGIPVKHFLSRGQQKLLICAMILTQGYCLAKLNNQRMTYLVDDLPSELDEKNRMKLLSMLMQQTNSQLFITAIEKEQICDLIEPSAKAMQWFHVKHGDIVTVDMTTASGEESEHESREL